MISKKVILPAPSSSDTSINISQIKNDDYVIVRDTENKIAGIITVDPNDSDTYIILDPTDGEEFGYGGTSIIDCILNNKSMTFEVIY